MERLFFDGTSASVLVKAPSGAVSDELRIVRNFIIDTYNNFRGLCLISENFSSNDIILQSRRILTSLRDLLRDYGELITIYASSAERDNNSDELDIEYSLYSDIYFMWNLCEIFILNPTSRVHMEMLLWLTVRTFNIFIENCFILL